VKTAYYDHLVLILTNYINLIITITKPPSIFYIIKTYFGFDQSDCKHQRTIFSVIKFRGFLCGRREPIIIVYIKDYFISTVVKVYSVEKLQIVFERQIDLCWANDTHLSLAWPFSPKLNGSSYGLQQDIHLRTDQIRGFQTGGKKSEIQNKTFSLCDSVEFHLEKRETDNISQMLIISNFKYFL
jgi:hypothetical protein